MKKLFLISILFICPSMSTANTFEDYFNEGIRLVRQERISDALASLEQAAALNPTHAQTYFNIGIIYSSRENYAASASNLEKAIYYNPNYTKAYGALGHVYTKLKRHEDAINCFKRIIEQGHATADTHLALGKLYSATNNTAMAMEHAHNALTYDPNNINVLFELGYFYTIQGSYAQAVELYKKVLSINPGIIDAVCNLAQVLRNQGNFEESRLYYKKAIEARPDFMHGIYGYAECCLILGDFEHGWAAFESRWKRETDPRHFASKLWDGSSLNGKTIILRSEYGQGDTLQFIRYAPLLKAQGATVILEAQHTLITLLSHCPYFDAIIPVDDNGANLPSHDFQVPLMSLPYYFKTTPQTIPCPIPYVSVPENINKHWASELKNDPNFKIGICWEGSPYYEQFKSVYSKKSIPLAAFAPIASLPNVSLYSLQKMNGTEQLKTLPVGMKVHDFGAIFDFTNGRFVDTAAVINNIDLVITTDTSVAHLAGALGKPVWVILPMVADWRWLLNRADSPWYPSMRLFRQTDVGRWDIVMNTVCLELCTLLEAKKNKTPKKPMCVMTEVQIGELVDKITILQIKKERIKDATKLKNIETELACLLDTFNANIPLTFSIDSLWKSLKKVNEQLWVIEDDIRDKERARIFDQGFIDLARAVYYTNDERCRIKRDINMITGSRFIEEKSYTDYKTAQS